MFESAFQRKKPGYTTKLNLVALMDIFTILVFFLLLNSGEAEKLESAKFVKLPDSYAGNAPHNDLVIMIAEDAIWMGDEKVASIDAVNGSSVPGLSEALAAFRERRGEMNSYEEENGLSLTIMGDRAVPYALLKTVMATCRLENFRDIALAVNQVAGPRPGGGDQASPSLADRSNPGIAGEDR